MTRNELKAFIEEHCFTKAGRPGLNSKVANEAWWVKRQYTTQLDQIKDITRFYEGTDLSRRCWYVCNSIYDHPRCVGCNNPTNFKGFAHGFFRTCSIQCATRDEDRNKKIVDNTDYIKMAEKVKQTNLERYGVVSSFQLESVKEKSKSTKLDRYGDVNYNNMEKNRKTTLERYGSEHWFTSQSGVNKLDETRKSKGGSLKLSSEVNEKLNDIESLIELNKTMCMSDIAESIGVTGRSIKLRFERVGVEPISHPSRFCKLQGKLHDDIIKLYSGRTIFNSRTVIPPKEIDIFLPDKNMAIELNGMYWHSELEEENKKYNHRTKLELCNEIGINLIQITDHEYNDKKDLVLDLLASKLDINQKIGARKCTLRKLDNKTSRIFLEENHFQGYVVASVVYGLYYQDDLISVMTFGKSRFNKKYQYELIRFCVKNGYNVVGGSQRMFKAFLQEYKPTSIISYCDLSKFQGSMYSRLGFSFSHTSEPNYVYLKGNKMLSRYQAQKHKLGAVLGKFDPNISESQNMFANGYKRYWDCGTAVYVYST